jgi:D-xylose 1-dehydrogenase (NADP+, D-xylono-1,5-lactone-forming)
MIRVGLLSTARIDDEIVAAAAACDEVEVVAVASREPARAEAYAASRGIPRAHASYDALLADAAVDVVYVPLPNSLHCAWAIRALEAGKHVLCEKPMSPDPADVEAVFDTAERLGLVCMEAFMWRHNPQTRRLSQLVADGAIGELRLIRSSFTYVMEDAPALVQSVPELEGGALLDIGCYCVSASRLFGGEPLAARAERVIGPTGVDDRVAATLRLPGDVLASFVCAFDLPEDESLEIVGSDGSLRVADPWRCRTVGIELRRAAGVERIEVPRRNSYRVQLENMARVVRGEEPQLLGRDDAVGQARALALVRGAWG